MIPTIGWHEFDALTPRLLHDMLRLRCQVFVVEQKCAFGEIDGRDADALHLMATDASGAVIGVLRLFAPTPAKGAVIGRIAVAAEARQHGIASQMIRAALARCDQEWPKAPVSLSAQAHLEGYYARFGFAPISAIYREDDIRHIDMERPPAAA